MTSDVSRFLAPDFLSLTIGIVVYFVGVLATQRVIVLATFQYSRTGERRIYSGMPSSRWCTLFSTSKLTSTSRRATDYW